MNTDSLDTASCADTIAATTDHSTHASKMQKSTGTHSTFKAVPEPTKAQFPSPRSMELPPFQQPLLQILSSWSLMLKKPNSWQNEMLKKPRERTRVKDFHHQNARLERLKMKLKSRHRQLGQLIHSLAKFIRSLICPRSIQCSAHQQ